MKFILWQNIISIHQAAFVRALSGRNDVILVVEREIEERRRRDGWEVPDMGDAELIVSPSSEQVDTLISDPEAVHFMSGIGWVFREYRLIDRLTEKRRHLVCYVEPYNWLGWKGLLRRLKYSLLNIKYGKHISALLPTGETGCRAYAMAGFPKDKLFEWGYFTEKTEVGADHVDERDKPRLLFVGSIDTRKNIIPTVRVVKSLEDSISGFYIIGVGPLESELKSEIVSSSKVEYLGGMDNSAVKKMMSECDILVLPSLFDGWGAVVNEALQCGMRVVCSENCGAGTLLSEKWLGTVFTFGDEASLSEALRTQIGLGVYSSAERERIISWTEKTISGEVVAGYFESICAYLFNGASDRPAAPWKR